MNPTWHDGWFPFGGLLLIGIMTLLVLALVFMSRKARTQGEQESTSTILDRRLASGEITVEEHARLLEVLRR